MVGTAAHLRCPRLAATFLMLASFAVSLLVAEGFVRLFFPHTRDGVVPAKLLGMDSELGWRLQPARSAVHGTRYFAATYRTNAMGYRDRERSKSLPTGGRRVLLMGDSQVFGWGVDEDQRFSNLLERACVGVEVWNTAVPGYGFDQELLAYERDAADVPANDAVFFLSGATLDRTKTDFIFSKAKPMFGLDGQDNLKLVSVPGNRATVGSALHWLLAPLYLPYFVQNRLAMPGGSGSAGKSRSKQAPEPVTELVQALILRAQREAAARGQRFVLLTSLRGGTLDQLRGFCARHGLSLAVVEINPEDPGAIFGPEDPHWTPQTHARLAKALEPVVCDGGDR